MTDEKRTMRSAFDGFGRELLDGARGVVSDNADGAFSDGFNEAAAICVHEVTRGIDALLAKITEGGVLTGDEQQVLARFTTLKTEMERELRAYWDDGNARR